MNTNSHSHSHSHIKGHCPMCGYDSASRTNQASIYVCDGCGKRFASNAYVTHKPMARSALDWVAEFHAAQVVREYTNQYGNGSSVPDPFPFPA